MTNPTPEAGGRRYRETLNRWAAQHVPDDAEVISVEIRYDEGWDPTYGEHSPSLDVWITYRRSDGAERLASQGIEDTVLLRQIGELLTELFAIEDNV